MKRTYRTSNGVEIDMEAMRINNEKVVAAGNMKVNARGDVIKGKKVVTPAKKRVAPFYRAKKEIVRTSVAPPVKKKTDEEIKADIISGAAVGKLQTREDGSRYREVTHPDGSISIQELSPSIKDKARKPQKPKPTV